VSGAIRAGVREAYAGRLDAANGGASEMGALVRSGRPLEENGLHMVAMRAMQDLLDETFQRGAIWAAGYVQLEGEVPGIADIVTARDALCGKILEE